MKFHLASVCALLCAASVTAQTIADVLRTNANGGAQFGSIAKTAALAASHPEWATPGTKTLVISVDSALTGNDTGFLFTDQVALKWDTDAKYAVLRDVTADPIAVYDNYNSGFTLHFRTGMEDLVALAYLQASNGYIYILPGPLTKLKPITTVLAHNANLAVGAFGRLIETAGLTNAVNNLKGVTFLVPNDTVIAANQARLTGLSQPQLQYLIANHILVTSLYSNAFGGAPLVNLNGVTLPATSGPNAAGEFTNTIGGVRLIIPNDVTSVNGPAQALAGILFPSTFPANAGFPTPLPGNLLAPATTTAVVATTTAAPVASQTGIVPSSQSSPTPSAVSKSGATAGHTLGVMIVAVSAFVAAVMF